LGRESLRVVRPLGVEVDGWQRCSPRPAELTPDRPDAEQNDHDGHVSDCE
jgi:hypothetical protein